MHQHRKILKIERKNGTFCVPSILFDRDVAYNYGQGWGRKILKFFQIKRHFSRKTYKIFEVDFWKDIGGPFWKLARSAKTFNFGNFQAMFLLKRSLLPLFASPISSRQGGGRRPLLTVRYVLRPCFLIENTFTLRIIQYNTYQNLPWFYSIRQFLWKRNEKS